MKDHKYFEIKDRIQQHAMELWGIKSVDQIDPVVDLLLDVFAYETFRLHQEIKSSDSHILHRLSRILIDNKWTLPMPAHALMSIYPKPEETCYLTPEDHFYVEKNFFGKESVQLFFTPLTEHKLLDAKVIYKTYDTELFYLLDKTFTSKTVFNRKNRVADYSLWIGIRIPEQQLSGMDELTLCLLPEDVSLLPFLKLMRVYDVNNNELKTSDTIFYADCMEESHYFHDIISHYSDYYCTFSLTQESKKQKNILDILPEIEGQDKDIDISEDVFWVRMEFPEVFGPKELGSIQILLNTYPVANRQLIYKQHDCVFNGKIVSLSNRLNTHFLNIHYVDDDQGQRYQNVSKCNDENLSGTFSLYFGDIGRFNSDSAKALITKLFQLMREDGNAFAAMNPETVTTHLNEIISKLEALEKNVNKAADENFKERTFLLTVPKPQTTHYEVKYWLTNGKLANGLDERSFVQQFDTEKFNASGLKLITETFGAQERKDEQELINSLRYGLLTRERIVSREDVKCFIQQQLNGYIEELKIKDGVAISHERKKGIVRTTEIVITLKKNVNIQHRELQNIAYFLEKELAVKSVDNTPYRILFQ